GCGLERLWTALVLELGTLVHLRVAEEELAQGRPAVLGGGDGVGLVDMGSDALLCHADSLGRYTDAPDAPGATGAGDVAARDRLRDAVAFPVSLAVVSDP